MAAHAKLQPSAAKRWLNCPGPKTKIIRVIDGETGKPVKSIDVTGRSKRDIEKIDSGLNINLNHDRYFTRLDEEK